MTSKVKIRMATPADAKDLLEIYAPYILRTGITFEYEVPSEDAFRKRIEKILEKYNVVAIIDDCEPIVNMYREMGLTVLQPNKGL